MGNVRSSETDNLHALAEAGVTLISELSLPAVLQKVVDVARERVGARYAALSVLAHNGEIAQFLTSGISQEERRAIGALPRGSGLLGVLLNKGESLRLEDMSHDRRSAGFPPHHPPMKSLLGVPLIFAGRIIGNLYLTDKLGAPAFDEQDEEIVRLLATQAAVAIRNAELYEAEQRRAAEWKALFDLGQEVTASPHIQDLLRSIVSRARLLTSADVATVMLVSPDGLALTMAAHEGLRSLQAAKLDLYTEAAVQELALESTEPLVVRNRAADERLTGRIAKLVDAERLVSMIVLALRSKRGPIGTLMVANREPTDFSEQQVELLEAFANWTAVAIESSRLYDQMESLARLEERERIGMDLHDGVMQSIYAAGLQLEDCAERLSESPEEARAGIERAIEMLNNVIRDIRSYIFDLRPRMSVVADLPQAIEQLVEDVRVNTLMETSMEVKGSMAGLISQNEALALFHIAQEALNNVSKHSRASAVSVKLHADGGAVWMDVRDNGVGIDLTRESDHEGQGLRNMRDRARGIGANISLESAPGKGTTMRVELSVKPKEG